MNEMEQGSRRIEVKESLEHALVTLLVHSRRLNAGNNGIIFDFDFQGNEGDGDLLRELGVDVPESGSVAKVLKVFSEGVGKREYENHLVVYDILQVVNAESASLGNGQQFALVPKPYYFPLTLTPHLADKLNISGASLSDRAEVLIMDKIHGKDVATLLYTELLKKHPKAEILKREDLDEWSFEDLQEAVSKLFYRLPDNSADAEKNNQLYRENAKSLQRNLVEVDFMFDPEKLEILRRTTQLLRKSGILLKDLHHRNIMIGDDGAVHMIDFGDMEIRRGIEIADEDYDGFVHDRMVELYLREINNGSDEARRRRERDPSYARDPLLNKLNVKILANSAAFRKGDPKRIGLSGASGSEAGARKMVAFSNAVDAAIDSFKESGLFEVRLIYRGDTRPKKEKNPRNNALQQHQYMCGILYKTFEAFCDNRIDDKEFRFIADAIKNFENFRPLFHFSGPEFFRESDFDNLLENLVKIDDEKQKKAASQE